MIFKRLSQSVWLLMFVAFNIVGCSDSDDTDEDQAQREAALVGAWEGEVTGTFGVTQFTMNLRENKSVSFSNASNSNYCPIPNLTWSISNEEFKMSGNDNCDGTLVQFNSPYSTTELSGSWNSSAGNRGSFSFTKQ